MINKKKVIPILKRINKKIPFVPFISVSMSMSNQEIAFFDHNISNSKHYLEFGSGGSTIRALQSSKAKIISVESDKEFIKEMREYFFIRRMENRRLKFIHADMGQCGEFGRPSEKNKHLFPKYSKDVFKKIDNKKIDTVLIDGRFRVACALNVILYCGENNNLNILLHDWHRTEYHVLKKYLKPIDRVGNLVLLEVLNGTDKESVIQDYKLYQYDPK